MKTIKDDFSGINFTASDIDWDFNDEDFTWSVDEKNRRPTTVNHTYSKDELFNLGVLEWNEDGSIGFDEERLLDNASDFLTDEYEFEGVKLCHNGFRISYQFVR